MGKKLAVISLFTALLFIFSGCSTLVGLFSGKSDTMMEYLESTNDMDSAHLLLLMEEETILSEEELLNFTENKLLPGMRDFLNQAVDVREQFDDEELLEVHDLLIASYEALIEGNELWLADHEDEAAYQLMDEYVTLYDQYTNELEALANEWGVTITWEELDLEAESE
ncbi:hypothetical protein P4637_11190 [Halalkalibacterium halodurans]|uniref:BH1099 protein n=1 Tax=Halalkalibacterium halodurans (strain ATCC BAA-125 / DSM 18197 / FERM 7344 / JCM 9153 / C-125) TaxID=272558 RepID=Q9KDW2_HALH5|nr:hypothetical protein [Halalkalibacterium halodurans]MDY7221632.1 hypothetical protein [Halalkalibacterium halodurans]MDY7240908.1 hypothetical protein [Halalkalibacterium halodurans]MED4079303.1 hypothetical protein [Halalkalibacterium halodurans]MED4085374.1 hypothetical protein [Halalkalibacterium halodurans]MED4104502.1 hypothetical protein [Halalkalibacterium halodurans]